MITFIITFAVSWFMTIRTIETIIFQSFNLDQFIKAKNVGAAPGTCLTWWWILTNGLFWALAITKLIKLCF